MTFGYQACLIISRDEESLSAVLYVLKSGYSNFLFVCVNFVVSSQGVVSICYLAYESFSIALISVFL